MTNNYVSVFGSFLHSLSDVYLDDIADMISQIFYL